jgi:HD-GYP domain-containing protein (c-di-GMP phosphodiesterase class II)
VLERAHREDRPLIANRANGQTFLAVSFAPPATGGLVAVAELEVRDEHLARQLAVSLVRQFHQGLELFAKDTEMDSLNQQVGNDLEAITFLLGAAKHIEHCDISRTLEDAAATLLPVLQDLVRSESLAFVPGPGPVESENRSGEDESATLWVGDLPPDCDRAVRLIVQFGERAARRPIVMNRLAGQPQFEDMPWLENFLLVRVGDGDETIGWLLAVNHARIDRVLLEHDEEPPWGLNHDEFGSVEARMMIAVANMLGVQHKNLRRVRERESLLIGLLRALVNAVDAKDPYTCGHGERVAVISRRLAEQLGLDEPMCDQLYLAGLLHDIGKIGVPDEVLRKPGKLDDEEFRLIQTHPWRGHTILAPIEHLSQIRPAVLHHHEHFDGQGYPQGLAREDIPLLARIIAVADAYDAMTSDRPYRRALPEQKVLQNLRQGAGTQWDPWVVEALLEIVGEIHELCTPGDPSAGEVSGVGQRAVRGRLLPIDGITAAVASTYVSPAGSQN